MSSEYFTIGLLLGLFLAILILVILASGAECLQEDIEEVGIYDH